MIRCDTCGLRPSDRVRADSWTNEPVTCPDPLHDLADQCVAELHDYCVEHGIAWTPDSVLGAVQRYDAGKRAKVPEKKEQVR